MAGSGIRVGDECIEVFQQLKLQKNLRYIIFKINDACTDIIIEKQAPKTATYDDFLNDLPSGDTCYGIFDFDYERDGGQRNKIIFLLWAPSQSKLKRKMLIASSKDALRQRLGLQTSGIQSGDIADIDKQAITKMCQRA